MSTKERHEQFKAEGWTYDGGFTFLGGLVIEYWHKGNETRLWTNAKHAVGSGVMMRAEEESSESLDVLVGTPVNDDIWKVARDVITPAQPFFIGAESQGKILKGAVCSYDTVHELMSRMAKDYGRPVVIGASKYRDELLKHATALHERWGMGYFFRSATPKVPRHLRTSDLLGGRANDDERAVIPMKYYHHPRAAVRREALTAAFDACYDDVREVLRADVCPTRLHVIAETPEFVIFGEPGFNDKLEREYGVRP